MEIFDIQVELGQYIFVLQDISDVIGLSTLDNVFLTSSKIWFLESLLLCLFQSRLEVVELGRLHIEAFHHLILSASLWVD